MAEINIPQGVADSLLAMPKQRVNDQVWPYPHAGAKVVIPLQSLDRREAFNLDLYRGRDNATKETFQNRARGPNTRATYAETTHYLLTSGKG